MAARLADRGDKKAAVAGDEDRIGALPDDVLQLLLSFLPSRDAVRTSVLATRWRTLWKSVPSLRISTDRRWSAQASNRFVNNLLNCRDRTAPLHVCEIICYDDKDVDEGCRYIEQWVQYAVPRQARVIRLQASARMSLPLSNQTLISEHMTRLQLSYVEFEDSYVDLSSCHALEVLKIKRCVLNLVGIFSKSLGRLEIEDSHHLTDTHCTSVSAPGLVTLQLDNCSYCWTLVLASLPSLVTAFIRTVDKDECDVCHSSSGESSEESYDEADDRDDCMLLQGLSGVADLALITRNPMVSCSFASFFC